MLCSIGSQTESVRATLLLLLPISICTCRLMVMIRMSLTSIAELTIITSARIVIVIEILTAFATEIVHVPSSASIGAIEGRVMRRTLSSLRKMR